MATSSSNPAFVDHCIELLSALGSVRSKRMFGGWGLYVDGLFMALIAFERLYLKVDEAAKPRFAAAGCEPFVYSGQGKTVTMSYWTAPPDAMDSPALMLPWARLALQAALSASAAKTQAAVKPRTAKKLAPKKTATKQPIAKTPAARKSRASRA